MNDLVREIAGRLNELENKGPFVTELTPEPQIGPQDGIARYDYLVVCKNCYNGSYTLIRRGINASVALLGVICPNCGCKVNQ